MAGDFRTNEAGRAKTANFLSQLFRRDPARAQNLRAKAKARIAADDNSLLDKLILQARLADEEDDPTPEDPGQDDPDEPEDPPTTRAAPSPAIPMTPAKTNPTSRKSRKNRSRTRRSASNGP